MSRRGSTDATGVRKGHPGWRTRLIVVAVITALVGGVGAAAYAGPTPAPLTPTNIRDLERSYEAQRVALAQRQATELARVDAYWAAQTAARQAAAAAEQAGITQEMNAATAPIAAARDALFADIEARRLAARAPVGPAYAAKRAQRQSLLEQHAAQMPPNPKPLSYEQALAVKAQLDAERKALEAPIDAQKRAEVDPLKAQYDFAKKQADTTRKAIQSTQKAHLTSITEDYKAATARAKSELEARLAKLDAEATALKDEYSATLAKVKAQQTKELDALKAQGGDTKALGNQQKAQLTEMSALNKIQATELKNQMSRTSDAAKLQLDVMKGDYNRQVDEQKIADANELAVFDAQTDALLNPIKNQIDGAELRAKELKDDLKAIYDIKEAVLVRDVFALANALQKGLELVGRQERDALKAIDDRFGSERDVAARKAAADIAIAEAPFRRRIAQSAALLNSDLVDLGARYQDARSVLVRRHLRETLLAKSDFQILRSRADAYLHSSGADLVPLDNFYEPAKDVGSLYNVAKAIGVPKGATGAGVRVALIDTGVAPVDGLVQADVTIGPDFSFEDMNDETRGLDTNGHGTHLAGIIAARDNAWLDGNTDRAAARALGVAPDARLMSIKAGAADGSVDVTQVIAAINWVIRFNTENPTDPIRVINLSYGTDSSQDYTIDPLAFAAERAWKAGIVVVVSGGNDGWDTNHLAMPAADPYVIAVGASQGSGGKAVTTGFSSEGSGDRGVDLVAPGRSVVSLRSPGSFSEQINGAGRAGDTLVRGSGTSQAAAVVTGAVALLLQQRPTLTPDQVKTLLMATAKPTEAVDPRRTGAGMLDVGEALRRGTIYDFGQQWAPATGTGSVEASRGNSHVQLEDGSPLVGEQDVFGLDFSGSRWRDDAWTGSRWRENGWEGSRWRDSGWDGSRWRVGDWTGSRWRDSGWDGSRWRGSRWRAEDWAGSRWRDSGWEGSRWRDLAWEGSRWRGFGL